MIRFCAYDFVLYFFLKPGIQIWWQIQRACPEVFYKVIKGRGLTRKLFLKQNGQEWKDIGYKKDIVDIQEDIFACVLFQVFTVY